MLTRLIPGSRSVSRIARVIRLSSSVPVYQKPYNPSRYEVPTQNLKISTGYAFLDVEPMPRARIMKLGYIMLEEIKKVPENTNLRLWYEEKAKWVMETVDETEDIRQLEVKLGKEI
jgi:NADH dehydrogenase (ubiquinone) 1 alpha subcomplex subunit 5